APMTEEAGLPETGVDAPPEARARLQRLPDLVGELAAAPSGVSFIASCLDRLCEVWHLRHAYAVLNDVVLGLQLFNAGRRPLGLDPLPSAILARGTGIQTEPTMVETSDELDAVANLCEV